jgi:AcrR family transcriptional regulator
MGVTSGERAAIGADEVRERLVDATIRVLARDGLAQASARAIAAEAGSANGLIFYHFGSMDGLLAATARTLGDRGIERIRVGLGGDQAHAEWSDRLAGVIRREAEGDDGRAVMELMVGSRTSPLLADEMRATIGRALDFATDELRRLVAGTPLEQILPVDLFAELAGATFLGLEVMTLNGREIDLDTLAARLATILRAFT